MTSTLPYWIGEGHAAWDEEAARRFTYLAKHGTQTSVTNSYLGIISLRGLETLVVETEHAAPFLLRRVARQPLGERVVCWAVLDERTAHEVTGQVACRRFQEAFYQLNTRALHLGTLVPPLPDDDFLRWAS